MTTTIKISVCPGCLSEIEDCCHCGSGYEVHNWDETHSFVPYGCECGFVWAARRNTVVLGGAADGGLLSELKVKRLSEMDTIMNISVAAFKRDCQQEK